MEKKTTLKYNISHLDNMDGMGLKLYWTPGAQKPYWASNPSFTYDVCVAVPSDFLESAGYDSFNEDHDYSGNDETLEYEVSIPQPR